MHNSSNQSHSYNTEAPLARSLTGRSIVVTEGLTTSEARARVKNDCGVTVAATARDMGDQATSLAQGEGVILEKLGVVVMNSDPDQTNRMSAIASDASVPHITAVEQEERVYAIGSGAGPDFLEGYRAGVNDLVDTLLFEGGYEGGDPRRDDGVEDGDGQPEPESALTWGLRAIGVQHAPYSGKGVRVCVLDTGFDLKHPDFACRNIRAASFVEGEDAQDLHGHGTHCIGTACGPRQVDGGLGYGVAYGADIFSGKVLGSSGSGGDAGILMGIEWAIREGCDIVSMSLGAPRTKPSNHEKRFEKAARIAFQNNVVIIAAAGNDRERGPDQIVSMPANSPSIFAVAAVDESLQTASFSNPSGLAWGQEVDIAGPGVNILSSIPGENRYARLNGTSMATPHVAGVLALLAEAYPDVRGRALAALLMEHSARLSALSSDVGLGLVQAPSDVSSGV